MSTTAITILIAIGAVAFFTIAMSLTLLIKGHHIKSEIADNPNMQKLGIKCTSQQFREEERRTKGTQACGLPSDCNSPGCGSCGTHS